MFDSNIISSASNQQCLEQPISPVTGAVTDTLMLAAQMENLGFREKAGSSGKRVDNGADSRPDDQVCPVTKIVILELLYFIFPHTHSAPISH